MSFHTPPHKHTAKTLADVIRATQEADRMLDRPPAVPARVTGQQVHASMVTKDIRYVEHHACGGCGYMTNYFREADRLYFDAGCNCGAGHNIRPSSFQDVAEWINMQTDPQWRDAIKYKVGLL